MTSGNQSDDPAIHATRIEIGREAWVAPNATLTGRVTLGSLASVWFGCVLRGDLEPITIGDQTNVQELTVFHVNQTVAVESLDGFGNRGGGDTHPLGHAHLLCRDGLFLHLEDRAEVLG